MIYLQIIWVFFVANILGYGGGPSIVPLIEHEVVVVHGWMSAIEFAEIFAMGNALPGPIAPKIAAFIGFEIGGVFGAFLGIIATIGPSVVLVVLMMGLLKQHKDSPQVQRLTRLIRPTIVVLIGEMAIRNLISAWGGNDPIHVFILVGISLLCLVKFKTHPVFVVIGALVYGAIFMGY